MPKRFMLVPCTLSQANELVARWHRHHKPVVGHRFSLACALDGVLVVAAIVGRPVSREINQYFVAEVTRLVTNGTEHACSFLYGACARIAKEVGFEKIQTYILESKPGTSLKASGWVFEATTAGGDWNHSKSRAGKRRTDQPMVRKHRYSKLLNPALGGVHV